MSFVLDPLSAIVPPRYTKSSTCFSLLLFIVINILLELVMLMALDDTRIGACIQGEQINNLRFADDIVNRVYESSSDYGLKINIAKTEVQVISKGKC